MQIFPKPCTIHFLSKPTHRSTPSKLLPSKSPYPLPTSPRLFLQKQKSLLLQEFLHNRKIPTSPRIKSENPHQAPIQT